MSQYFTLDYIRLGRLLLPIMFRHPIIYVFVGAADNWLNSIYSLFGRNRDANLYQLNITPQVCYLEKALNDRFDYADRRIYISDGVYYAETFLYTNNESLDKYVYAGSEANELYIYAASETGVDNADFVVNVPLSLTYNDAEMKALIDLYKLASKKYIINKI